jgi:hypothetical protein
LKKVGKKYPFLRFYNFSQGDISADKKISPFPSFPQIGSRRKEGREPIYSSLSAELEVKDSAADWEPQGLRRIEMKKKEERK